MRVRSGPGSATFTLVGACGSMRLPSTSKNVVTGPVRIGTPFNRTAVSGAKRSLATVNCNGPVSTSIRSLPSVTFTARSTGNATGSHAPVSGLSWSQVHLPIQQRPPHATVGPATQYARLRRGGSGTIEDAESRRVFHKTGRKRYADGDRPLRPSHARWLADVDDRFRAARRAAARSGGRPCPTTTDYKRHLQQEEQRSDDR